jgi:hypothetical protein
MNDRPPVINIDVPKQPRPVINIDVPKQTVTLPKPTINLSPIINVPQQQPPTVNVEAYPRPKSWTFDVERDGEGRICTVTAKPNY